ncbi:MAG: FtsX-like permease family protein [Syntrophorhabdaceae bacterium PtaU1.Bin034]|jgi:ABC-type lipoprotein release transport system permease subunit|nr:MAG: FtsX-like permease family protein [Syntrophorhabdaceae bacterium PtaU1.Bin034]
MKRWIDRQRNIINFTLAGLNRRRGKNLALLVVYTCVVMLLASVSFFTGALKNEARTVLEEAPEIVVQRQVMGRHDMIPTGYGERILTIRGVVSVKERLWGYYFMDGANYTVMTREEPRLQEGSAALGAGVSRTLHIAEGDALVLRSHDGSMFSFEVKEVLPASTELVAADLILVSPEDFRAFFGIDKGLATDLVVQVRNPREAATVAGKIAVAFPDTRPILRDEIARTYDAVFDWRSGMIVVILAVGLLSFVIFAFEKASGLSAEERREIGVLKAIGWETGDVILMKAWEAISISLTAFLFGTVIAYIYVFFASAPLFNQALKGWSVLYPDFRLSPFINTYEIAILFLLTVVPYIVATIVPSWRASIVDPDSVMRA